MDRAVLILIVSLKGAQASAAFFSIVESAKTNNQKPYEYLKCLLTEMPKHMEDTDFSLLDNLLPWSDVLPNECGKPQT